MYRLALRTLGSAADAEDACQEAFERMYRSFDSYDPSRPLGPWAARITYHVCLRRLTKVAKTDRHEASLEPDLFAAGDAGPESLVAKLETREIFTRAVDRLPAQDRALLALRYREGMTQGQVADAMGMPEGTVKVRLHRARAALKRLLLPQLRRAAE